MHRAWGIILRQRDKKYSPCTTTWEGQTSPPLPLTAGLTNLIATVIRKSSATHSPNSRTAVTETMMATTSLVIFARKIGMASTAAALEISNVTSSKWCLRTSMRIRLAYFCCRGFPPRLRTSSETLSRERRPSVSPDIRPENVCVQREGQSTYSPTHQETQVCLRYSLAPRPIC